MSPNGRSYLPLILVVPRPSDVLASGELQGLRAEHLALIRVRPDAVAQPQPISNAIILVDTSASRALGFDRQLDHLTKLLAKLASASDLRVHVACFDQTVMPVYEGSARGFGDAELNAVRARGALGASDLERALDWARGTAAKGHATRLILLSDGVATAGATEGSKLAGAVASLRSAGIERMDAIATGGIRDDALLARLVRGNLAYDGITVASTVDIDTQARRLREATRSGLTVTVEGATWSYPQRLDGVQSGDEFSIYAELAPGQPVVVKVDGKVQNVTLRAAEYPLLERAWAQTKVASLLARDEEQSRQREIVTLAVAHRIVTPYTAMLVLETERDYARYGIDRRALGDVMVVQNGRVVRERRAPPLYVAKEPDGATPQRPSALERPNAAEAKRERVPERAAAGPTTPRPEPTRAPSVEPRAKADRARPAPEPPARASESPASESPASEARRASTPPARDVAAGPEEQTLAERNALRSRDARDDAPLAMVAEATDEAQRTSPYTGKFEVVMGALRRGDRQFALQTAAEWHAEAPGDVMALVALGEACEATGAIGTAARAYGSIVDLFSNRADLRRFAGERLERLASEAAAHLATDTYAKAASQRPDHPASHRLLAFAYLRRKLFEQAFETALGAVRRSFDAGRFPSVDRILREDLGLIAAAWVHAEPRRRADIEAKLAAVGCSLERTPSLRFVLNWETDANDVDFHIFDARGGHAFYGHRNLESGGELYADITTGYGPECFTIAGTPAQHAGPYKLQAHYYSRGPMGYGMGKLEIVEHDGQGNLKFEERPFVVMVDHAFVDLGTVR